MRVLVDLSHLDKIKSETNEAENMADYIKRELRNIKDDCPSFLAAKYNIGDQLERTYSSSCRIENDFDKTKYMFLRFIRESNPLINRTIWELFLSVFTTGIKLGFPVYTLDWIIETIKSEINVQSQEKVIAQWEEHGKNNENEYSANRTIAGIEIAIRVLTIKFLINVYKNLTNAGIKYLSYNPKTINFINLDKKKDIDSIKYEDEMFYCDNTRYDSEVAAYNIKLYCEKDNRENAFKENGYTIIFNGEVETDKAGVDGLDFSAHYTYATKYNPETNTVQHYLVFEGTQGDEWGDYIDEDAFAKVFANFQRKFEEDYEKVMEIAQEEYPGVKSEFMLTGHSRGGAMVNMAVDYLNTKHDESAVTGYAFAAPSAMDKSAVGKNKNLFNIVNTNDIVPKVPTSGYRTGNEIYYNGENTEYYNTNIKNGITDTMIKLINPLAGEGKDQYDDVYYNHVCGNYLEATLRIDENDANSFFEEPVQILGEPNSNNTLA